MSARLAPHKMPHTSDPPADFDLSRLGWSFQSLEQENGLGDFQMILRSDPPFSDTPLGDCGWRMPSLSGALKYIYIYIYIHTYCLTLWWLSYVIREVFDIADAAGKLDIVSYITRRTTVSSRVAHDIPRDSERSCLLFDIIPDRLLYVLNVIIWNMILLYVA